MAMSVVDDSTDMTWKWRSSRCTCMFVIPRRLADVLQGPAAGPVRQRRPAPARQAGRPDLGPAHDDRQDDRRRGPDLGQRRRAHHADVEARDAPAGHDPADRHSRGGGQPGTGHPSAVPRVHGVGRQPRYQRRLGRRLRPSGLRPRRREGRRLPSSPATPSSPAPTASDRSSPPSPPGSAPKPNSSSSTASTARPLRHTGGGGDVVLRHQRRASTPRKVTVSACFK